MCDYSLHAVASRPAQAGEALVVTKFGRSSTYGFASPADSAVAVCLLPGTELAFAKDVRYQTRFGWMWTVREKVAKFDKIDQVVSDRHHDAIEFPGGKRIMVTDLGLGQSVTVVQLPASQKPFSGPPPIPQAETPAREAARQTS